MAYSTLKLTKSKLGKKQIKNKKSIKKKKGGADAAGKNSKELNNLDDFRSHLLPKENDKGKIEDPPLSQFFAYKYGPTDYHEIEYWKKLFDLSLKDRSAIDTHLDLLKRYYFSIPTEFMSLLFEHFNQHATILSEPNMTKALNEGESNYPQYKFIPETGVFKKGEGETGIEFDKNGENILQGTSHSNKNKNLLVINQYEDSNKQVYEMIFYTNFMSRADLPQGKSVRTMVNYLDNRTPSKFFELMKLLEKLLYTQKSNIYEAYLEHFKYKSQIKFTYYDIVDRFFRPKPGLVLFKKS